MHVINQQGHYGTNSPWVRHNDSGAAIGNDIVKPNKWLHTTILMSKQSPNGVSETYKILVWI